MFLREENNHKRELKIDIIANEALRLFKEKGYKKVTVDEIVKKCNTSKGSFYHHYKSKADILNRHFMMADQYYEKLYANLPATRCATDRLALFLTETYMYLERTFGKEFLSIVYSTSLESETHLYFRNPNRKLFMLFEQLLTEIMTENPTASNLPVHALKQSLITVAMGIVYYWCTIQTDLALHEIAKAPITQFINGFK